MSWFSFCAVTRSVPNGFSMMTREKCADAGADGGGTSPDTPRLRTTIANDEGGIDR